MLVLQRSSILKGPGGMRGKILVFLLEAGDQRVIFLVPLGDTVGPLFCGMSAGQTALSDAREIKTRWAKEIRACRYFTLPFLVSSVPQAWELKIIENWFCFFLPRNLFVLQLSYLKPGVVMVGIRGPKIWKKCSK